MTLNGVFIVDKPRGMTSHDVVAAIRKKIRSRAVGHAGTLDPMATGVLVVCAGEATKLVPYLTAADKEYETTIALGTTTETLDADGTETTTTPVSGDWRSQLEAALEIERARRSQIPPNFSAIHVNGRRAHELARKGERVELDPRDVQVASIHLRSTGDDPPHVVLRLAVSKGYYVRALARDLAASLGTVAHLTALRRVRSGPFCIEEASTLDAPDFTARALSIADAARRSLPEVVLDETQARDACHGKIVHLDTEVRGNAAWLDQQRNLIAVGRIDESGAGRVLRGFKASSGG